MIAELLLVLAGHDSSLFQGSSIHPSFCPLLHPGEKQILESIAHTAMRYRRIRSFCTAGLESRNRYICTLCSTICSILRDEYEHLIIQTEAKILSRDDTFVGRNSFVPVSVIRSTFSEWDAPFKALVGLLDIIESKDEWLPGPLIDLLLEHSSSGIIYRISTAVQKTWITDISSFLIHGSVSMHIPLAAESTSSKTSVSTFTLLEGSMPSCVTKRTQESIIYIGRAIATVTNSRKSKQLPRSMGIQHAKQLDEALPRDIHKFEHAINTIRNDVSEWLWLNVLTREDVEDAVGSLANYFLLRDGEFGLALIREFERLKISRITLNSSKHSPMIREQDLHLAMLRASLGTSAQHDPTLSRLRFVLPAGPLRLLLSLQPAEKASGQIPAMFNDMVLGTELKLTYTLPWPIDLFLTQNALSAYDSLFAFLSTIRKTHVRVLDMWISLSNAQRARRRWTGTGEGGTDDQGVREQLLRCGWGCARTMNWFLEVMMEYVWGDVVDEEYTKLKNQLMGVTSSLLSTPGQDITSDRPLDFNTLRLLHSTYLNNLLNGTLVSHPVLAATLRSILETCEQFVAQIEKWGGDVLPPLLFEGSVVDTGSHVGEMVKERSKVVKAIHSKLTTLLETMYEQLSTLISQPLVLNGDASTRSFVVNTSATLQSFTNPKALYADMGGTFGETRRHLERLLLRLDFSNSFSKPSMHVEREILPEGGLT